MAVGEMERRIGRFPRENADPDPRASQRRFFRHEVKTYGARGDAVKEIARQC